MECPFEYDTNKLWPNAKYVVIQGWYNEEDKLDRHPWCSGIYDSFYEALGHAYNSLSASVDSWRNMKRDLPIIEPMEDDSGWTMVYHDEDPGADDTSYMWYSIFILYGEENENDKESN